MLELEAIQYKGFRNLYNNAGETIGFQVPIRFVAYRGPWLSQFRFAYIEVDGVKYRSDVCTFVISGVEYTYEETFNLGRVKWPLKEAVVVRISKPGGLAQGMHTVSARFEEIASYIPFRGDEIDENAPQHGHSEATGFTRSMLIV